LLKQEGRAQFLIFVVKKAPPLNPYKYLCSNKYDIFKNARVGKN